ncbi:hypothetical protein DWY45_12275 [Phocaeicola plebeius]|nr:hypothetical protein DWY45_12275 [Phocaeicola plebeius]
MKYSSAIAILTLAFFSSCSCSTNRDRSMLPENPTNNQTYRDSNGNSWIYNAMLMRWMMSSPGGNTYYYYPSQGYYTNSSGVQVTPPASVSSGITPSRSSYSSSTFGSKSTSKGAVFGSTGRGHSISA